MDLKPLLDSSSVSINTRKGMPKVLGTASMVKKFPFLLIIFKELATRGKYLGAFSKSVIILYMRCRGALIIQDPAKTIGFM